MDEETAAVLEAYHQRIQQERAQPREAPGGRDGGQDQRMRAVGPQTGQLLNILARGLDAPTILELGTSFGYSGIWLARALPPGGRLITIEFDPRHAAFGGENLLDLGPQPQFAPAGGQQVTQMRGERADAAA